MRLALAIVVCLGLSAVAVPLPDAVFHGAVTVDGVALAAASQAKVSAWVDGVEVATYTLGELPEAGDSYLLAIPLGTADDPDFVHLGDEVFFTVDGETAATSAVVTEQGEVRELVLALGGTSVRAPVMAPGPGAFAEGTLLAVELLSATPGALVYYTLDGSAPDPAGSGILYTDLLLIVGDMQLRARAFDPLGILDPSPLAHGRYRFFASHTVTFDLGAQGTRTGGGELTQAVAHGAAAVAPEFAVANGWTFVGWSTDFAAVTVDLAVSALFRPATVVPAVGPFDAEVDTAQAVLSRGLWHLTGSYESPVAGGTLWLALVHDPAGRLGGQAAYTAADDARVNLAVRGTVKGSHGSIAVKVTLRGTAPVESLTADLVLSLALDAPGRHLVGRVTGTLERNGGAAAVDEELTLPVPAPMDGAWGLHLDLTPGDRGIAGTARLTLSNDVAHAFVVEGRASGTGGVALALAGAPLDPTAKAIRIKAFITPLEGGQARIEGLAARAYGQSLGW